MSVQGIAVGGAGVSLGSELPGKLRELAKKGLLSLATAFTNIGASIVTNRMIQAGTAPKFLGWGTGVTPAAVTDLALQTENAPTVGGGRTVGAESRVTTSVTNDTYQVTGTITATLAGPTAQTEAGTFDAATAGNMLLHSVFSALNLNAGDSLTPTFGLKFVPGVT
jgi:hypothetical protein